MDFLEQFKLHLKWRNLIIWVAVLVIISLLHPLYHSPLLNVARRWGGEDNAHGALIFGISLFLFWLKRKEILAVEKKTSMLGFFVTSGALLFYLAAKRGQINALMAASFIPLLFGLIFYLGGKRLAWLLSFPIFYLFLCLPTGMASTLLSVRLRIFSTVASTAIVDILGISIQRVGTYVYTPDVQYDIASPCSGLNSLISLIALSLIFAYLTQKRLWRRAVIVVMAVPIALFSNTSRIVGLTLAARGFGAKFALTTFHDWSGYFTFAFGLLCLFGISYVLGKIPGKAKGTKAQRHKGTEEQKAKSRRHILPHLGIIIGLLCLTLVGAKVTENIRYFSKALNFANIPLDIGEWKGEDVPINEKEIIHLPKDTEHFKRTYTKGETKILLAIVQSKSDRHSIHPPEACFPAQGWSISTPQPLKIHTDGDTFLNARRMDASFKGYQEMIVYWYQKENLRITNFPLIMFVTVRDLVLFGRSNRWAFIRLSSPLTSSPEEAEKNFKDFIRELWTYVQY